MPRKKKKSNTETLSDEIVAAMLDKKAKEPVIIDFTKIQNYIADFFIICHGTSKPHVEAIADHVIMNVKKKTGQIPLHREGFENAEWILIDYSDIIVHVFQETPRKFYNLEQLWADAEIKRIDSPE
jgi:ribosome-associated protein